MTELSEKRKQNLLKSFLKDGEAEQYDGVTITYIHGRTAIMNIYNEHHQLLETIQLHTIRSKEKLHQIMKEKGFQSKTKDKKIHSVCK